MERYTIDEIKSMLDGCEECEIAQSEWELSHLFVDPDHIRELLRAEEEGRLIILPAKTVVELTWDAGPNCDLICPVIIDGESQCDFCDHGELCIYKRECKQEHIPMIGKTVFLTREEAEATLKGGSADA